MGYYRAGFTDITGVDIRPMPRYPFNFVQADALDYARAHWQEFDVIHASPPCKRYSPSTRANGMEVVNSHPHLLPPVREFLVTTGKPFVIENVFAARRYMNSPLMLCGTMFGLNVIRHRMFDVYPGILIAPFTCRHYKKVVRQGYAPSENEFHCVTGSFSGQQEARDAMGIDWMTRDEISQAIPPAYTEYIGRTLLNNMATQHGLAVDLPPVGGISAVGEVAASH